jgi:UDP-glucose 4-epimerase
VHFAGDRNLTVTVLVTGGAGYIGSHMVLALVDAGEAVVVLDDLSTGFASAVPPGAPLVVGDVGDEDLLARTLGEYGITTIAHFAARMVVPESVRDPLGYYLSNTVKSRALIEAAVRGGVTHLIFSSTAAVYGDIDPTPVSEDQRPDPVSPYGRSKLMVEWMLEDTARASGLRYAALRYFNVAGADPAGRAGQSTRGATHLIKVAVQTALGHRSSIDVYGTDFPTRDGSGVRDFIQVSDLVSVHMAALRHLRSGGRNITLNCGYGRGFSVLEVLRAVEDVSGRKLPIRLTTRRPGDPSAVVANVDRLQGLLGWRPSYDDLHQIVLQALRWEERFPSL